MSARDRIFAAVRHGLGGRRQSPEAIAREAAALLAEPDAIRPPLSAASLTEAFSAKAAALGTTLDRVAGLDDVPAAVRRYRAEHGLPPEIAVQPASELARLAWGEVRPHAALAPDQVAAVGLAGWGIAESGSVVIHSGPDNPMLLAFLPLHHLVVLPTDRILPHLEDYAAHVDASGSAPRNAILITGPSGTTDIEGSYVRGAHGPGFVHVILVDSPVSPGHSALEQ